MDLVCRTAIVIFLYGAATTLAHADYYKVYSPVVDEGEASAEADINFSGDHRKPLNDYWSQVYGIGYGVTRYWSTEISGEVEKSSSTAMQLTTIKWENILAPFAPGEYWVDAGLYLEAEKSTLGHTPNNIEARLLLEKTISEFTNTLNISFTQNVGPHSMGGIDNGLSWRTKYHYIDRLEPGIEYYSDLGRLSREDGSNKQDNSIGPVLSGHFGEISYDTGILAGISRHAHDVTAKLNLEYTF